MSSENEDMSNRKASRLARTARNGNLTEEHFEWMRRNADAQTYRDVVAYLIQHEIVPHAEAIRDRAQNRDMTPAEVREHYKNMDDEAQQVAFDKAVASVVSVFALLRQKPQEGLEELKAMIRDPWTLEAILLIFRNDEEIDPEYSDEIIQYAAWHVQEAAYFLAPELYTEEEREFIEATREQLHGGE